MRSYGQKQPHGKVCTQQGLWLCRWNPSFRLSLPLPAHPTRPYAIREIFYTTCRDEWLNTQVRILWPSSSVPLPGKENSQQAQQQWSFASKPSRFLEDSASLPWRKVQYYKIIPWIPSLPEFETHAMLSQVLGSQSCETTLILEQRFEKQKEKCEFGLHGRTLGWRKQLYVI